jgi:hypothetical protein
VNFHSASLNLLRGANGGECNPGGNEIPYFLAPAAQSTTGPVAGITFDDRNIRSGDRPAGAMKKVLTRSRVVCAAWIGLSGYLDVAAIGNLQGAGMKSRAMVCITWIGASSASCPLTIPSSLRVRLLEQ